METKLLCGELFLFKFKLPTKSHVNIGKLGNILPGILVACRVIGSLPEQVKQKANLSDNSTLESHYV